MNVTKCCLSVGGLHSLLELNEGKGIYRPVYVNNSHRRFLILRQHFLALTLGYHEHVLLATMFVSIVCE